MSEGRMTWQAGETWYRVVGELDQASPLTPVVICHGGPGAAHDYTEPIADLSRFGRACVLYDQLGRERSTGPDWGGYTVDEAALRHGAGVEQETTDPQQAHARFRRRRPTRYREGWLPG